MNFTWVRAAVAACILGLSGLALAADPPLAVDTPTAADFAAPPTLADPVLSPDGTRIAVRALDQDKPRLLVLDAAAPDFTAKPVALPAGQSVQAFRWAGKGRLVLTLADGRGTRLFALDLATSGLTPLSQRSQGEGDEILHIDPAGRFLLLSTTGAKHGLPAVDRVDLATGETVRIVAPQEHVSNWYADTAGVIRAGVGYEGNKRWLLYRANDGQEFARTRRRDAADETLEIDQVVPVQGSDRGYAVAGGGDGRYALYRYDFSDDRIGELIYENPRVDIDGFQTDQKGNLLGVILTEDQEETLWLDPGLKALQDRVDAALPGTVNRIASMSDDRARLLVWSSAPNDPGAWYLFDSGANAARLLARPRSALAGKRLAPVKSVRYAARDGLEIGGYLTLPVGRDPAKLPLIVMPHGGPFARDDMRYDSWVQYLASKGYAVLQPNFRGSTGFGRGFVEKGDGEWGRGMQNDIDDGVRWLASQGIADPGRVCIMGASFGGYAAMWAAVRNPELYRCAISFAGISDIAGQLRYDRPGFESGRSFKGWRTRIRGNRGFELESISPLAQVARLRTPILIAHGADDDNVPVIQSVQLHDALTKLGRPHEFVVYPGEGHGLDDPKNEADFLTRVGAFLDRFNPA
ncbi:S9 family peptidase [Sphingomonas sp. LB-2]|uniref:S9 family peptidase n=1 Tax=Sphingomonas caeni TaxID=2984949 RepID=UPI00222EA98D|nr:S9 family peptidase [Sphingomonas caeni]MCW3847017.1 S9 family peptidase [Sphingomonas caeni]